MPAEKETKSCILQVTDLFSSNRTAAEVFADLILTEHGNVTKRYWTGRQSQAIIKLSTVEVGNAQLQS